MAESQATGNAVDIEVLGSPLRLLAVGAGTLLIGSFLSVFLHLTDVAGGTGWLVLMVAAALLLATIVARRLPVRRGVLPGLAILGLGPVGYLVFVPELHGDVTSPTFVFDLGAYLTGVSVLRFLSVDVWAIAVAPGPTFLTWYLLLRRRYDLAGLVGGLAIAFFTLTGDAGPLTTLAGMTGLLGVLGIGTLECEGGNWDQLEELGLIVALAVFLTRVLSFVPDSGRAVDPSGSVSGPSVPIAGDLTSVRSEAEIFDSISLSPTVYFAVEADRPDYWRVAAFDRYTGSDWIRTGKSEPFDGGTDGPPGPTRENHQTVTVRTPIATMPAAWKPVRLLRGSTRPLATPLGGLDPDLTLAEGDSYTVLSEVPTRDPDALRRSGWPDRTDGERFVQLPGSLDDRVATLARRIGGEADTAFDATIAIQRWLTGTKDYSLTVDPPNGDLVGGFLFDNGRGYCVYFASAMAVMLRTLGIPTRFVLGYSTGRRMGDGRWMVRGLDSHAWVEVGFEGVGWVPFDPTPSAPRENVEARQVDRDSRRVRTATDTGPGRSSPTATTTSATGGDDPSTPTPFGGESILPGGGRDAVTGSPPLPARDSRVAADTATEGSRFMAALDRRDKVAVLAGTASLVLGLHWFRVAERGGNALSLYRQRPTDDPRVDVARAYDRVERMLSRQYRPRREEETPRQYLSVLDHGDVDDRARRLGRLYERARYSSDLSREDADEAIDLADQVIAAEGRLVEAVREFW